MKIILLGAPGAGKGTQASFISEQFSIPKISTGDMLREAIANSTAIGLKVKDIMAKGEYVSDDIIMQLINERISKPDCKKGFLLDGFPRTMSQVTAVKSAGIKIDFVIEIKVPESEIVNRLSNRRVHVSSGRVYHLLNKPPVNEGIDDITGEALVHRDDDKPETILQRLDIYNQQTAPLVEIYKQDANNGDLRYFSVDGTKDIESIKNVITNELKNNLQA